MERHKLDAIDLRILSELQDDGRITNVELSRRAKITAPPCLRRMRALEKAGYIKGYHADLYGKALGYEVTGFAFVGLNTQAEADLKRFEEQVRGWPAVPGAGIARTTPPPGFQAVTAKLESSATTCERAIPFQ